MASPNLQTLLNTIKGVINDSSYKEPQLIERINDVVNEIAAGIRMPDGQVSPPLPDLMETDTVSTATDAAYVSLPSDYQRALFLVLDSSGDRIVPPSGGDYYSFMLFLRSIQEKDLSEAGRVYRVCVKGSRLYYQGIPSSSTDLTVYFYRQPTAMSVMTDIPDGLPAHLAKKLIKHGVCKEIYGEGLEDGEDNQGVGFKYHSGRFIEAMTDLIDFIGIDAEPQYYAANFGYMDPCYDG